MKLQVEIKEKKLKTIEETLLRITQNEENEEIKRIASNYLNIVRLDLKDIENKSFEYIETLEKLLDVFNE